MGTTSAKLQNATVEYANKENEKKRDTNKKQPQSWICIKLMVSKCNWLDERKYVYDDETKAKVFGCILPILSDFTSHMP